MKPFRPTRAREALMEFASKQSSEVTPARPTSTRGSCKSLTRTARLPQSSSMPPRSSDAEGKLLNQMPKTSLRLPARVLIITALMSSLLACQGVVRSANQSTNRTGDEKNPELALLHKYGWAAEGDPTEGELGLPRPVTALLSTRLYLAASKGIGLDFSDYAGQTLPLRNYKRSEERRVG